MCRSGFWILNSLIDRFIFTGWYCHIVVHIHVKNPNPLSGPSNSRYPFLQKLFGSIAATLQNSTAMEAVEMNKRGDQHMAREIGASSSSKQRDEVNLARLGKRGVLKVSLQQSSLSPRSQYLYWQVSFKKQRNFGFMAVLGFSTTILITWEGNFTYATSIMLICPVFSWLFWRTFLQGLQKYVKPAAPMKDSKEKLSWDERSVFSVDIH